VRGSDAPLGERGSAAGARRGGRGGDRRRDGRAGGGMVWCPSYPPSAPEALLRVVASCSVHLVRWRQADSVISAEGGARGLSPPRTRSLLVQVPAEGPAAAPAAPQAGASSRGRDGAQAREGARNAASRPLALQACPDVKLPAALRLQAAAGTRTGGRLNDAGSAAVCEQRRWWVRRQTADSHRDAVSVSLPAPYCMHTTAATGSGPPRPVSNGRIDHSPTDTVRPTISDGSGTL
jgi:hypothetical protein